MNRARVGLFLGAVLVLMLFVMPTSAAFNVVPSTNNRVFIGEQGLDVSKPLGVSGNCIIGYYPSGSSLTDAPSATRTITTTSFYVSRDYDDKTGVWYRMDGGAVNATYAIYIDKPRTQVYLRNSVGDDITGKAVTRGETIDFRVETNLYSIYQRPLALGQDSTDFPFKIKVESPSGVTYTALYTDTSTTKTLLNLPVTSDLWLWGADYTPAGLWDTSVKDTAGTNRYQSGEYKISAECNANSINDNNNFEGATKSPVKTLTIASDALTLAINKDSITRGEQFVVTIAGVPTTTYELYVKSVGSDIAPKIVDNQEKVVKINNYKAEVTTSTSGTRTVGFYTDSNTKDKRWTIRVETASGDKYDEVTVTVIEGVVSVSTEDGNVFYLGQEVVLSGINTETDTTYLYMYGPNLPSNGGKLDAPHIAVIDGDASTFVRANVLDDNTYEYKWNTAGLAIDSGTYTVYATSEPRDRNNLGNTEYSTTSVSLRKPMLNANIKPTMVAQGDKVYITGNAEGQPSPGVAIWVMGKNFVRQYTTSVEDDGTFEYEMKSGDTQNMATGQYFVVVQHPMYNDEFDVYPRADGGYPYRYVVGPYPILGAENVLFTLQGAGSLQGSDAAQALIDAIGNAAVDDIATRAQFTVDQAQIAINSIDDVQIGNEFTISGKTNLAVGNHIQVEVISSSFGPTHKTQSGEFSGFSSTVEVVEGTNTWNAFSIEVPSENFIEDEYIVTVSSVLVDVSTSTTFNAVEYVATPTPTTKPTTEPTTKATTTAPTTTPTTAPTTVATPVETPPPITTKAPGFGALIALGGLGAVATLVVIGEKKKR